MALIDPSPLICSIALWNPATFVQMVALGSKMALRHRVLGSKMLYTYKSSSPELLGSRA